jgi:transcription elongation GreA/GreB family factor
VIYRSIQGGDQKIVQIARSTADADRSNGIVPTSSPLAKSMLGRKVGDVCEYSISTGSVKNIIEEIDNI